MFNLRSLTLKLLGAVPLPIKTLIYSNKALLEPLAALIKRIVPSEGEVVVNITGGPNKGQRLIIDRSVPNYFWLRPDYEPGIQTALASRLHTGCIAADIGAHMGFDTLHMARLVGPCGHVHAFEPDPINYRKLSLNCQLNDLNHVTCHNLALSDQTGDVQFQAYGTTTSHIATSPKSGTITVSTCVLDEVLNHSGVNQLDLVKLDVEGAETKVLQGAKNTLKNLRPIWLIEIHSAENLTGCGRLLLAANYHIESVSVSDYYNRAIKCLQEGIELPTMGFDIGHIRATPAEYEAKR